MDFDLKLKAISRLAQSETAEAAAALRNELDKLAESLATDTDYELLEQSLEILDAISHRFADVAVVILLKFIRTIESRHITYSQLDPSLIASYPTYRNATSLIVRATEVLVGLRYFETKKVLHALLELSIHTSKNISKKGLEGLSALANYNIDVFYGPHKQGGLGAQPQQQIIDEIEQFDIADLKKYFTSIVVVTDCLLSPSMRGTSWSYKTVTLLRTTTPGHFSVAAVRKRSIELLKRLYAIASNAMEKVSVLNAFKEATRIETLGRTDEESIKMVVRDTIAVLEFFGSLVQTEDLPIIQNIESKSYWIFFHAIHSDIEPAALAVESAIAQHSEYQIYKILIGFEGVSGDWAELRKTNSDGGDAEDYRRTTALKYAASITSENYPEWRQRILKFAETESNDLAMFPIFYLFLETFAVAQPKLALRLASEDSQKIANFLIPLLRALSAGPEKKAIRAVIQSWIAQGRYLPQATKQFLRNENLDLNLLILILRKAEELRELQTITLIMSVAVSNYETGKTFLIEELFLPALDVLTQNSSASWIFDIWFRRETRVLINDLSEQGLDSVLRNLFVLEKIDYHAEEILFLIAERRPDKVLQFFCRRLEVEASKKRSGDYDAIPYELHKVNKSLSKVPRDAVRTLHQHYDGDSEMFFFRGAHFLKTIFPHFPPEFETELLNIVKEGGEGNYKFVLAILRNYEGQPFIHRLCKEIIRLIPIDSSLRTDLAIALENTGAVVGEFGFAEAYERKKNEVKEWLNDPEEKVQDFARWYINTLDQLIAAERKRAEEDIALRKLRYGETDSE